MVQVQLFPEVTNKEELDNLLCRVAWHFSYSKDIKLRVAVSRELSIDADSIVVPENLSDEIFAIVQSYIHTVDFNVIEQGFDRSTLLDTADVVLKWIEADAEVDRHLSSFKGKIYRVDPIKVRQEGSFYIQCAFDLSKTREASVLSSKEKFNALSHALGYYEDAYVLATGPSIENFEKYDYQDALVIICNSISMNRDIIEKCKPKILVFADPIFHFGVSQYAGEFRKILEDCLSSTDITVIIPLKYYELTLSVFPKYESRIIGVPYENISDFNLDLNKDFVVKTTANILTLLMLPIATSFADNIHLMGCDGRPLEDDGYFWGHGKGVQIDDKMKNIQETHPGFFSINYNDYYLEHCNLLASFVSKLRKDGKKLDHFGFTHIPALQSIGVKEQDKSAITCIVIEPDGIGEDGHYVKWHNNLVDTIKNQFKSILVLCNKKQDINLYNVPAMKTFTSHSWGVSRSQESHDPSYFESIHFKRFVSELNNSLNAAIPDGGEVFLFCYYGSIQILEALRQVTLLQKQRMKEIKSSMCLFHESVILPGGNEPKFHPKAKSVFLLTAPMIKNFRLLSVTCELSELIMKKFDVRTDVLPNPIPDKSDSQVELQINDLSTKSYKFRNKEVINVFFPGRLRPEKGGEITSDFYHFVANMDGGNSKFNFIFNHDIEVKGVDVKGVDVKGVQLIGDTSDKAYWAAMNSADIIVIPYLSPYFTYRTSGIIVDAIFSGAAVVVLSGTWLAGLLPRSVFGLHVKYYSSETILSAVKVLSAEASNRRPKDSLIEYYDRNSWSCLVDKSLGGLYKL